jgi:hypothetical protein
MCYDIEKVEKTQQSGAKDKQISPSLFIECYQERRDCMERFYLDGVLSEELSSEALQTMSARLSAVVSLYFSSHPEEYLRFLEEREEEGERRRKHENEEGRG